MSEGTKAIGAGAVKELDDGAAECRAFRALGDPRDRHLRAPGRDVVMLVLRRCRCG